MIEYFSCSFIGLWVFSAATQFKFFFSTKMTRLVPLCSCSIYKPVSLGFGRLVANDDFICWRTHSFFSSLLFLVVLQFHLLSQLIYGPLSLVQPMFSYVVHESQLFLLVAVLGHAVVLVLRDVLQVDVAVLVLQQLRQFL